MTPNEAAPEILSKILLIQNVISTLPDAESILGFTARGLEDLPGVRSAEYRLADSQPEESVSQETSQNFPVQLGSSTFAVIYCSLDDEDTFSRYEPYVNNLCFMIAARLEEDRQRIAAAEHGEELEQEIQLRTREAERERERAQRYLDAAETLVVELDAQGRIERINQRGASLFGMTPNEIRGKSWFDLAVADGAPDRRIQEYVAAIEGRAPLRSHADAPVKTSTGEIRYVHWHNILRRNGTGAIDGVLSSGVDVTERRQAEAEKEVLLKEVYHRTKNNMHVINSLLALQSDTSDSDQVKASLLDARNRIMAMALVHNMLYASEKLAQLDLHEYLTELGENLLSGYSGAAARIYFSVTGPQIFVNLETAIACGIVLNEIMTNSAKHAFTPESESPTVTVDLNHESNMIEIHYRDNGVGLPEDMDLQHSPTLGMQIIHNIAVEQLRGTLSVGKSGGFEATLRIPEDPDEA